MKQKLNWIGWGFGIAGWAYLLSQPFSWYPTLVLIILLATLILLKGILDLIKRKVPSNWMSLFMFVLSGITFGALIDIPHLFVIAAVGFITYFITLYAMEDPSSSK